MLFENLRKKEEGEEGNVINELKELLEKLTGIKQECRKDKEEKPKEESSNDEVQFIKATILSSINILVEQGKMMQKVKNVEDNDTTPFKMKFMLMMIACNKYTDTLLEFVSYGMNELSKYPERLDKEYMENILKLSLEFHSYVRA